MGEYQVFQTSWQGIALSVSYDPDWLRGASAHLEVRADRPLPITESGYRSHFTRADVVEADGDPVALVLAWLDYEAAVPAWQAEQAATR